jgi:dienelactone hydrolase
MYKSVGGNSGNRSRGQRASAAALIALAVFITALRIFSPLHSRRASRGLELQSEDYSKARSHFQTHLLHHGPAPQDWSPLHAPDGAIQVTYSDTPSLVAWITPLPANAAAGGHSRPAVLFLHGGFATSEQDWQMIQPYRDAGYVVMMPALRGENGQDGNYAMFYNEVDDVLHAADYLSRVPGVDSKHLYLAGHSVGGTLTLLTTMTTDRFRAAASFSGSPDQIAWSKHQPEVIPFDPNNLREFQMRSPIAYATSFKCPVRLYFGSEEKGFGYFSRTTADLAKQKNLDVEAVAIPGDHVSEVPEAMRRSIQFFQAH